MIAVGVLLAAVALVGAAGWSVLILFAMAIGAPGPTPWQLLVPMIPAIVAGTGAVATLVAAVRRWRWPTLLGGIASAAIVPAALFMLSRQ